jgi:hypothetical protein
MPRAKVPRTAIEYVELVDKRGIADVQRIFGCSRRAADQVVLQARRMVAQGYRYEVLDPPSGAAAVAVQDRAPRIGHAFTDAEVQEMAAGIDPPELKGLTAEERHARFGAEQDRLRRERNAANGHPELDPRVAQHWRSLTPAEQARLRKAPA